VLQMQSALLKKQRLNSSLPCDLKKQYTKKTNSKPAVTCRNICRDFRII
jgi:hypothetical protein